MKRSRQTGFTMVELLLGMAASAIVLLGTTSILVGAHKSWYAAWERMNLQRDASFVLRRMTHTIRPGTSVIVNAGGDEILVNGFNGWTRFFRPSGTNDLQCEVEGNPVHTLVNGTVQSLTFRQQDTLLEIQMALQKDNIRTNLVSSVMMRNTGG